MKGAIAIFIIALIIGGILGGVITFYGVPPNCSKTTCPPATPCPKCDICPPAIVCPPVTPCPKCEVCPQPTPCPITTCPVCQTCPTTATVPAPIIPSENYSGNWAYTCDGSTGSGFIGKLIVVKKDATSNLYDVYNPASLNYINNNLPDLIDVELTTTKPSTISNTMTFVTTVSNGIPTIKTSQPCTWNKTS